MSQKWRNWYQNEVDEIKGAMDSDYEDVRVRSITFYILARCHWSSFLAFAGHGRQVTVTEVLIMNIVCNVFQIMHVHSKKFQHYSLVSNNISTYSLAQVCTLAKSCINMKLDITNLVAQQIANLTAGTLVYASRLGLLWTLWVKHYLHRESAHRIS